MNDLVAFTSIQIGNTSAGVDGKTLVGVYRKKLHHGSLSYATKNKQVIGYATFISCYDNHGVLEFDDTYRVLLEVGEEKEDYEGWYVMEVQGNSMEPRIMDKAKLLIKPLDLINWKYVSNGVDGEYFSVKRIKGNESIETNRLTLYPDNPESGNMERNLLFSLSLNHTKQKLL